MAILIAFDIETTGLSPYEHTLLEIAGVKFHPHEPAAETFQELARPGAAIPAAVRDVTGITDEMVAACRPPIEVVPCARFQAACDAVLASPEHRVKASLRSPSMLPRLAVVDPDLTLDVPPDVTAATGLSAPKTALPAAAAKPEVSPLVLPPLECPLVYRGTLFMEGIEYLFLEGKNRTYRVTVGDTVEGFRILRRDGKTLHLAKDGRTIELSAE